MTCAIPPRRAVMRWSPEQQAIFDWFASGQGNLVVRARAGTGKTTTIKAAFGLAPESRILYAVFNKRNQREAQEAITDSRVEVRTLHSLGYAFIKRTWPNAKPDDDIEFDRARQAVGFDDKPLIAAVVRLVSFAKNLTIAPTHAELIDIAEERNIDDYDLAQLVEWAMRVLELSKQRDAAGRISFDDMVWLPVACNMTRQWYDLVCVDEAQDMNLPQLAMARQAVKPGGRIAVIGDDRQSIYQFRGAAQDGLNLMRIQLRAQVLPLTVTRRCPKAVVELAQRIVQDFTAAPEAPQGTVKAVNDYNVEVGDAVLSRLNAPLMPLALSLLRKNIPARIEGRDIGKQLSGMVRSMKAKTVESFFEKVEKWKAKQIERLDKAKNSEKKIEQVQDIAATLLAIAEGCDTVEDIEARINNLFADTDSTSKPAVVLSTVHKAKGLEWPRVFIVESSFARKGPEEDNVRYVALTRAKQCLFLVGDKKGVCELRTSIAAHSESPEAWRKSQESKVEVNYSALDKVISKYGTTLEQVQRDGMLAIYRQSKEGWTSDAYEVIRIKNCPDWTLPDGKIVPAHEGYPGSEEWGRNGWTCLTLDDARRRFEEMKKEEV